MLNTITGANCIQSTSSHCKLHWSEVAKNNYWQLTISKLIKLTKNIKLSWHATCKSRFLMWIFFFNFNFIVSFQYWETYVAVFTTNDTIRMFPTYEFACCSNVIYMSCEWLNSNKSLNAMQTDWEKRFPD